MRKNRGYKRDDPFRDARLFLVVCEGERREPEYFEALGHGSKRLKVCAISAINKDTPNHTTGSSPKWLLNRLVNYIEQEGVNPKTGDIIWLVLDVDRWEDKTIRALASDCQDAGWGIAISNPCFEVWLFMHVKDIVAARSNTCQEFKSELPKITKGGYNLKKFMAFVPDAIVRARDTDSQKHYFFPDFKTTKVYLPVGEILEMF